MSEPPEAVVREAHEEDVSAIQEIILAVYGGDYPYQCFFDDWWLKRSVFGDDILMLVAEEQASGQVLGTASIVFDVGAHSDLSAEFGRLAVHPDAQGRGLGNLLMKARVDHAHDRIHVGLVENRCVHPYSQMISETYGFAAVGFLPLKIDFKNRENMAMYCRHFGSALRLRRNNPRIVPEAAELARLVMNNVGLRPDIIVDEESAAYVCERKYSVEDLDDHGVPALIRIERGRVRNREIFGPMRLHYGFFQLSARRATYLVARSGQTVAGAIGYVHDEYENNVKVFELITQTDDVARFLLQALLERCESEWKVLYVEVDVTAHKPRMQRTLLELGFLPAAYVPAMVFDEVERLDVVRMVRLLTPLELGPTDLTPKSQEICDVVLRGFARQQVRPRIAAAYDHIQLFEHLTEEQGDRLAGAFEVARFERGEHLFGAGEPATGMYIVIQGRISVYAPNEGPILGQVGAGEALGEISLLTREAHSATAIADSEVVTGVLSHDALKELTRLRPDIGVTLYRQLAVGLGRKLRRASATLTEES